MTRHCRNWDEVPEAGAKRVLAGRGADLVTVRVPAGFQGQPHSHPDEQFVQVISGEGTLWTAQGEQSFGPGSVFHFPAGVEHRAEFSAETLLVETNLRG